MPSKNHEIAGGRNDVPVISSHHVRMKSEAHNKSGSWEKQQQ